MAESKNNGMKILVIIAIIVVVLVIAYAIWHFSGAMKMFNPKI